MELCDPPPHLKSNCGSTRPQAPHAEIPALLPFPFRESPQNIAQNTSPIYLKISKTDPNRLSREVLRCSKKMFHVEHFVEVCAFETLSAPHRREPFGFAQGRLSAFLTLRRHQRPRPQRWGLVASAAGFYGGGDLEDQVFLPGASYDLHADWEAFR